MKKLSRFISSFFILASLAIPTAAYSHVEYAHRDGAFLVFYISGRDAMVLKNALGNGHPWAKNERYFFECIPSRNYCGSEAYKPVVIPFDRNWEYKSNDRIVLYENPREKMKDTTPMFGLLEKIDPEYLEIPVHGAADCSEGTPDDPQCRVLLGDIQIDESRTSNQRSYSVVTRSRYSNSYR